MRISFSCLNTNPLYSASSHSSMRWFTKTAQFKQQRNKQTNSSLTNSSNNSSGSAILIQSSASQFISAICFWTFKLVCYIAGIFSPASARSHWLLRGHMTSNNKTVSRQKSLSGQHCSLRASSRARGFCLGGAGGRGKNKQTQTLSPRLRF